MENFNDAELNSLYDNLKIFDKMYEIIRFVDPLRKQVLSYEKNNSSHTDSTCFNIWHEGKICDNCISMRAYNENETFVKIEYTPERIFMVTAVPVEVSGRRIVVELLKDSTDSMYISSGRGEENTEIHVLINNLNNMALKDVLIDVFNRRFIIERLPVDILRASINNQGLSIIIADLDNFKKINDTYGHLAGDQVLKDFANCIRNCIREKEDWIARYGGEEFIVCLPNTDTGDAFNIAERMRKTFEDWIIVYEGKQLKATASFGVCNTLKSGVSALISL